MMPAALVSFVLFLGFSAGVQAKPRLTQVAPRTPALCPAPESRYSGLPSNAALSSALWFAVVDGKTDGFLRARIVGFRPGPSAGTDRAAIRVLDGHVAGRFPSELIVDRNRPVVGLVPYQFNFAFERPVRSLHVGETIWAVLKSTEGGRAPSTSEVVGYWPEGFHPRAVEILEGRLPAVGAPLHAIRFGGAGIDATARSGGDVSVIKVFSKRHQYDSTFPVRGTFKNARIVRPVPGTSQDRLSDLFGFLDPFSEHARQLETDAFGLFAELAWVVLVESTVTLDGDNPYGLVPQAYCRSAAYDPCTGRILAEQFLPVVRRQPKGAFAYLSTWYLPDDGRVWKRTRGASMGDSSERNSTLLESGFELNVETTDPWTGLRSSEVVYGGGLVAIGFGGCGCGGLATRTGVVAVDDREDFIEMKEFLSGASSKQELPPIPPPVFSGSGIKNPF